jgi:1-deoxy-D-xylulose-5-phosphate synthase
VVAIYATFLNRAFDQLLMDVALHRLPVTFALDRAGVTGPDGASHNGMWDGSILQVIPGLRIAAPRDAVRLAELLNEAVAVSDGPTVVRYPKGTIGGEAEAVGRLGGMDVLHHPAAEAGRDVLLVGAGPMAITCLEAAVRLADQGIGDAVGRLLRDAGVGTPVRTFGLPQEFLEHGKREEILSDAGLVPQHLARGITEAVARLMPELEHQSPS